MLNDWPLRAPMRSYEALDCGRSIAHRKAPTAVPEAYDRVIMETRFRAAIRNAYGITGQRGPYTRRFHRSHDGMTVLQRADELSPAQASLYRYA